jgi:hypothetical protein
VDYSSYEFLDIHVEDGIAMVRINRPDTLNATTEPKGPCENYLRSSSEVPPSGSAFPPLEPRK